MNITAALISHYLDHDAANMSKKWYSGTIVNKLQEVNSIFLNQNLTLAVGDVSKSISWSAAVHSSITLHIVVHGKTATKLEVKSGSLPSAGIIPF